MDVFAILALAVLAHLEGQAPARQRPRRLPL